MQKKLICLMMTIIMIITVMPFTRLNVNAATNPYPTTQDVDGDGYYEVPCTRFAWQQVYDNLGIALPAWGNAVNWWQSAKNAGYATGSAPKAGSIAVWSGGTYGHVAYVTSGSGNTFTVNEGGRTDLDTTGSHGVAYGYTLTNAVGGARPYDTGKTLLGFIYPKETGNIPQGCVDSITAGTGYIDVRGWAFDKDSPSSSLSIHVYIGGGAGTSGAERYVISANQLRNDVNSVYGISGNHGFSTRIYTGKSGSQSVHIYAINIGTGSINPDLGSKTVSITKDTTKPTISNVQITDIDENGYTVTCSVSDNCKVTKVLFPSWNNDLYKGDDAVWVQGTISGNTASARINISTLRGGAIEGNYATHVYAYDLTNNVAMLGAPVARISKNAGTEETPTDQSAETTTNSIETSTVAPVETTTAKEEMPIETTIKEEKPVETTTAKKEIPVEATTEKDEKPTKTTTVNKEAPIVPVAKAKVKKATKAKTSKKAKISLKRINGVSGYQVQISKNKKFKAVLIKKNVRKVTFTISSKKIKKIKTLYVRARAFIKKNGKIYYGDWSKVKKVNIKNNY